MSSARDPSALCLGICGDLPAPSARADTTTLTPLPTQGTRSTGPPAPCPLHIFFSRSRAGGDTAYPLVVSYHTVEV
jgi:hypothetical protein